MAGTTSYTQSTHPNSDMYHCAKMVSLSQLPAVKKKTLLVELDIFLLFLFYDGFKMPMSFNLAEKIKLYFIQVWVLIESGNYLHMMTQQETTV